MTIRAKIIIVVAATLFVGASGVGYLFYRNCQQDVVRTSDKALFASRQAFANLSSDSVDMMAAAAEAMASNSAINSALASRDRLKLLTATAPIYESYHKRFGITQLSFWEPEPRGKSSVRGLVSFLRTSAPGKYGDMVERVLLERVVRNKVLVHGLDMGNTGLAFRVVAPLYWKGKICGYFEIGKDIASFLASMKLQSGDNYGIVLEKSRLDEAKWISSRVILGERNNWNDMKDLLVAKNTYADDSILRFDGALSGIGRSGRRLGFYANRGRTFSRGVFPLYDSGEAQVGGVFVLSDITGLYQAARRSAAEGILAMVLLMAFTGFLMCTLFSRLIVARLKRLIRVATRVVGGEFDLEVVPSARDEVGRFEELFEQFRRVFVDLIRNSDETVATLAPAQSPVAAAGTKFSGSEAVGGQ